jgi:hypothetical protein
MNLKETHYELDRNGSGQDSLPGCCDRVAVYWLTLLLLFREVPGSNLDPSQAIVTDVFPGPFQAKCWDITCPHPYTAFSILHSKSPISTVEKASLNTQTNKQTNKQTRFL